MGQCQFPLRFLALFSGLLSFACLRSLCVGLLLLLFFFLSRFGPFSGGSSLLSSRSSPLPWFACLELGVCDFLFFIWSSWQGVASVFFSSSQPPLPCTCTSLVLFSFVGFCLHVHFCLWVHCFLDLLSLLCLFTLTCSSTLVLRTFPRILVSFLGCLVIFLLGRFFLSSLGFGLVWFLFTFSITWSNLSSFVTGSSLWAELSRMVVSWGSSGLSHLRSLVVRPLPVLVDGSLFLFLVLLGWWSSSASVRSFGVPHLLSLHGAFHLPVWTGFLSLVRCCHLPPFRVSPHSLFIILWLYPY